MAGLVQLDHVSKRYGQQLAVDDVSCSIAPAEIVGFVGPNGAGKSTTLRILTGLLRPDAGRVLMDGVDQRTDPTGFRSRLGALLEAPAAYPTLSAWEHLAYIARLRRAFDEGRIRETLLEVGLDPNSRKHVGKFSLGMKQRLGIAMALYGRPALLVLDEPMNGLDPVGMADLRALLKDLPRRDGTSVLMSSHLLSEVEQICHRVVFIRSGRLLGETKLAGSEPGLLQSLLIRTGDDARALEVLQRAPFVAEATTDGFGLRCRLAAADVPKIAPMLVQDAIDIFELTTHGRSLEGIYLAHYAEDREAKLR